MATQITLNVEAVVTAVRIYTNGPRLYLEGVLRDVDRDVVVRHFTEDVTDQLTPTQLSQITSIVTRAQQWADNKLSNS